MSGPPSRLRSILAHLVGSTAAATAKDEGPAQPGRAPHLHTLSPTFFLERAAAIEPDAEAIYHITANGAELRRSYREFADRARGLAYFLKKRGLGRRVGMLAPNTPAFLETIYGVAAAGGVIVPANYRLKEDDVAYIFTTSEVDTIVVDREVEPLLGAFRTQKPDVVVLVDEVSGRPSRRVPMCVRAC